MGETRAIKTGMIDEAKKHAERYNHDVLVSALEDSKKRIIELEAKVKKMTEEQYRCDQEILRLQDNLEFYEEKRGKILAILDVANAPKRDSIQR